MKYILLTLTLLFTIAVRASEPLRIGVITDTHYLSEKLMDNGYALDDYMLTSGRMIKYTPTILDSVLNFYDKGWADDIANIDVLLVCGDMSKDGEKQSHLDFVKKLKPLQDKGVKVFVVPGNHDINMPNAVGYRGNKTYKTENVSPVEFAEIYKDCGYQLASKRDPSSLSYVAVLEKDTHGRETWLLTIDAARYNEYKTHSITGGRITATTEKWIVDVLDEAKAKNISVIGMMHWGVVEHIPYQSVAFTEYLVDDWRRLASLFADKGMRTIFTGHFHSNDISEHVSASGNKITDIETGTLCAYPFTYRQIDYYPTSNMNISTHRILSIPQNPNLAEQSKAELKLLSDKIAKQKMKSKGLIFTGETFDLLGDIISQVFILHLGGDEVMTYELRESISKFQKLTGESISELDLDNIELDFRPADNDVTIQF